MGNNYLSGTFLQRTKKLFGEKDGLIGKKCICASYDSEGVFFISTEEGVFKLNADKFVPVKGLEAPAEKLIADNSGNLFAVCGKSVYVLKKNKFVLSKTFEKPIKAITCYKDEVYAANSDAVYLLKDNNWSEYMYMECEPTAMAYNGEHFCFCAGNTVYYIRCKRRIWQAIEPAMCGIPDTTVNDIQFDGIGYLWIATDNGLLVYDNYSKWLTPENCDILPAEKIYSITTDSEGARWLASSNGVIYENNGGLKYLVAERWAPAEKVNGVVVSADCKTAFILTDEGISRITVEETTLEKKAAYYLDIINKYQRREGYVTCRTIADSEDFASGYVHISDNDGLWTERYIASEAYRYAVTGDKSALENARESLQSMFYLMNITGINGFVARAIRRKGEVGYGDGDPEWHLSADGSCEWKGETSSDEITGHFFGMNVYYKLCADEKEKAEISDHLCSIIDYALENDYKLCDVDGLPTSWANWSPDSLNLDEKWVWESGINSFEFLSYLKTVYNMSGKKKYLDIYNKLLKINHYGLNLVTHKKYDGHVTHIDDQLGFLTSITFLSNEENKDVRRLVLMAMERHFRYERKEITPMWCFIHSVYTGRCSDLENAVQVLKDMPLNLYHYRISNSERKGLVFDTEQEFYGEPPQLVEPLPIDERPIHQDDSNKFVTGERERHTLEGGAVFTLPYWYARYHHLIEENNK